MADRPVVLRSLAGIKRDGTEFEGDYYTDGLWCRFQRGLPRKMAGYQSVTLTLPEKVYGMSSFSADGTQYAHLGSESALTQVQTNAVGAFAGQTARTPAGFTSDPNNLWQFDVMFDSVGTNINYLIAHAAPNLADISSMTEREIWFGQVDGAGALTDTGQASESGGIVVLAPYLLSFGNSGHVAISDPNDPTANSTEAWVTGQKIVRGMPLRGGGQGPSGIFWSLDSVIRATFVGDTPIFAFDTLSSQSSILSSQSVIEYDGIYFWCGVDRFLMFNGVVREVPNQLNLNWFFDNLNYTWAQKVFAFKVPRWGEIWWCYPRGSATECTHAVIFNVRENTWYDTPLPSTGRSAAVYANVYRRPFMTDVLETGTGYTLWQHEVGVNSIKGAAIEPVRSYFQTADISLLTEQNATDKALRCVYIEPDFVQVGDMTVTVTGRANARAPVQPGELFTFPAAATDADTQVVDTKEIRRLMRFKFESNTTDGDYQMGQCIAHIGPADGRITQ